MRQSVLQQRQMHKNPDARKKLHKDAGVLKHLAPLQQRLASRLGSTQQQQPQQGVAALAQRAAVAAKTADAAAAEAERREAERRDMSRRQYMHKFRQVVESADVVLEVAGAKNTFELAWRLRPPQRHRDGRRLLRRAANASPAGNVWEKPDLQDRRRGWLRLRRNSAADCAGQN